MSGYSIGDRVDVRWNDVLYPGNVIKLHSAGEVDVVYEINNTVGVFLTAKEHGLKLVPEKVKVCLVDHCSNQSEARGLCGKHGRRPCLIEGCATKAMARGLCTNHEGKGKV